MLRMLTFLFNTSKTFYDSNLFLILNRFKRLKNKAVNFRFLLIFLFLRSLCYLLINKRQSQSNDMIFIPEIGCYNPSKNLNKIYKLNLNIKKITRY